MSTIAVINYGMGNLRSVQKALEKVGHEAVITSDAADLERADKIVLPGVGAFADAIADSVVMIRVIHHLTDAPSALSELARITRPAGHLILLAGKDPIALGGNPCAPHARFGLQASCTAIHV